MRRVGAVLLIGALLASCSSDRSASPSTPAAVASAPAPTTASAVTTAPAAPAAVVPEVLCFEPSGFFADDAPVPIETDAMVYFAYTNAGATAVAIPDGAANVLQDANPEDRDLRPTVFAPGRVSPAFSAMVADGQQLPAWTLTGPDGTARTATADGSTPVCTDDLLRSTPADTRQPDLTFAYHVAPDAPVPADQVAVVAQVSGVPETSVCPAGLEPRPVDVSTDDGNGGSPAPGSSVTRTVPLDPVPDPTTGAATVAGGTTVAALVIDVCAGAGAETRSWPAGAAFARLRNGVSVCFEAAAGEPITMELRDPPYTCSRLAATGGVRTR